MERLYELLAWLDVLIVMSPIVAFTTAWARIRHFYLTHAVPKGQKRFYVVALALASISCFGYLGYWGWWAANLYQVAVPIRVSLTLEMLIRAGVLLCAAAIGCFAIGRGPYRVLLVLTTGLIGLFLWFHIHLLHWA